MKRPFLLLAVELGIAIPLLIAYARPSGARELILNPPPETPVFGFQDGSDPGAPGAPRVPGALTVDVTVGQRGTTFRRPRPTSWRGIRCGGPGVAAITRCQAEFPARWTINIARRATRRIAARRLSPIPGPFTPTFSTPPALSNISAACIAGAECGARWWWWRPSLPSAR